MSILVVNGSEYVPFSYIYKTVTSCHLQDMYFKRSARVVNKVTFVTHPERGVSLTVKPLTPPSGADGKLHYESCYSDSMVSKCFFLLFFIF